MGPAYDKMIDSKFADMKNTGGRHGGSITAAQFLKRYVDETPWAHLDIAGTAMGSPAR
jgi:leucyl aminopeptidase